MSDKKDGNLEAALVKGLTSGLPEPLSFDRIRTKGYKKAKAIAQKDRASTK